MTKFLLEQDAGKSLMIITDINYYLTVLFIVYV